VSQEGVWLREIERPFQIDGPEIEKERRPTVDWLNLGIRKHKESAAERRKRGVYSAGQHKTVLKYGAECAKK